MPDIMILAQVVLHIFCTTTLLYYTKCQSRKRRIIQSNNFGTLPKVNQVIYTLGRICEQSIMILAQAVLEIFCSQGSIGLQRESRKKKRRKRGITLEQQF